MLSANAYELLSVSIRTAFQNQEPLASNCKGLHTGTEADNFAMIIKLAQVIPWQLDINNFSIASVKELPVLCGEMQGTLTTFIGMVVEEDQDLIQKALETAIRNGTSLHEEFRLRLEEQVFWISLKAELVFDKRKSPTHLSGVLFDVSEKNSMSESLRASKELSQLIIDSSTVFAIITLNKIGLITSWNPGAEKILQWSSSEILNQTSEILFTPEDKAIKQFEHELQTAVKFGKAEDERWHMRKNGSRFWASGLMMPLKDKNGDLAGFLKILRDQTEKRRDEERTNLLIGELNHRVKNTLVSVQGIAQLTQLSKTNPEEFVGFFNSAFCSFPGS